MNPTYAYYLKIAVIAAVVIILGWIGIYFLTRAMRRMGEHLGKHLIDSFFKFLQKQEDRDETHPKSLLNMEGSVLPQILRDFPDFDAAMAKNQVKDYLLEHYKSYRQFQVHNVVISEYRDRKTQKSLVFQAAVSYRQQKQLQKRLQIVMNYQNVNGKKNPAINCPNCGATLGFNDLECKYCGTRINDRRDQEWAFTAVGEI